MTAAVLGRPVTAAFVTYNSADHIEAALASLDGAAGAVPVRRLVIDNTSIDDTVALAARAGAEVISARGNLGYSGAINVARCHLTSGSELLIANPDLTFGSGCVARLQAALAEEGVGVAVPRLLNPDGTLFHHLRTEPSLLGALGDALFGARWGSRPRWLSNTLMRCADYAADRDVDWAGGAAMLVSAECNAVVGPWDADRYFLYSEETDYQRRVRAAGFKIRYVADAEITHVGGGSGRSAALLALMAVNRIRYYRSYHGPVAAAVFRCLVALHHLLRASDADHRTALRAVLSERTWTRLPGEGRPTSVAHRADVDTADSMRESVD